MIHGRLRGTGFFIGNDGSLLTCFHVIGDRQTGKIKDKLKIEFEGKVYSVECIFTPPDPQSLDVAVLRLEDRKLPLGGILLPLGKWKSDKESESKFHTFGFRSDEYKGLAGDGKIIGRTSTKTGVQLLQFASEAVGEESIRQGMSGSPVYINATGQIVGMISSRFKPKQAKETIPFAVPIEEIAEIKLPVEGHRNVEARLQIKDRILEDKLVMQFSKIFQPGKWFTKTGHESFYESLPIPNLDKYEKLGKDKPRAILEQLREKAQGRIYDLINYIRSKRPDIPLANLIKLPPDLRINFVNREDELKEACGRYPVSNILFEAPAGYGKTELLKAIEQRDFRDGWLCVYTEMPKDVSSAIELSKQVAIHSGYLEHDSMPDDTNALGYMLAGFLKNRVNSLCAVGVTLLIDSIENLSEGEVDAFLNHFLTAIFSNWMKMKPTIFLRMR